MAKNSANFELGIRSIKEYKFYICQDDNKLNKLQAEDIELTFGQGFEKGQGNLLKYLFGVSYYKDNELMLELKVAFEFSIQSDEDNLILFEDDQILVPDTLIPHIISVSIGTIRGMLVTKTAGTSLSKFPLPLYDPNEIAQFLICEFKARKVKR